MPSVEARRLRRRQASGSSVTGFSLLRSARQWQVLQALSWHPCRFREYHSGQGYFLQSYAAVFIGCTVSKSGVPCVVGTLVGTIILAVLANGLTILQMPSFMQNIITGGIIILAVVLQKLGAGHGSR